MVAIYSYRYKQIGAKIAYYRRLRNFTQEELAQRVNLSTSSLGKIERGKYNKSIPLTVLMNIAAGLHIDIRILLTFEDE